MAIITQEMLQRNNGKNPVQGVILCRNYSIQLTKTGKEYVQGELYSGVGVPFKAWSTSSAFNHLKNEDFSNTPVYISGTFDDYGGTQSIVVDTVQAVSDFNPEDFLPIKYNIDAYFTALINLTKSKVSEKAFSLLDKVLFSNQGVAERFKVEFAAMSHHDNCKGGLLAHTYKVVNNSIFILNSYQQLTKGSQDYVDLIIVGATLHDIGKIFELNFGNYQPCSVVTHRYLGIELIQDLKSDIIESYNEKWYYDLVSIFLQHHGEFDDDYRSLAALIIHKADILDSEFTSVVTALENPVHSSAGDKIKFRDKYLEV